MNDKNLFLSKKIEVGETLNEECTECQTRGKENELPKARLIDLLNRALLAATDGDEISLDELRKEMNQRVEDIIEKQQTQNTSNY